jgi:hypothetical protein
MSGIHGLIKILKDNGKQVSYENLSPELNSFLNNNSFYDGLIIDRNFPIQEIQKYETKTYTPFFKFPSKDNMREKAVNTIQELLHRQTKIVGQYKMAIDYILSEYANNMIMVSSLHKPTQVWGILIFAYLIQVLDYFSHI